MSAMGGVNTGRSNKDEEANPSEELRHTTPTTNIEKPHHPRQGIYAPNTESLRSRRP
jgi:hypothetical protein